MNNRPDVEPVLRAYLAESGDRAPDRVLEDVAARIARQPRRRTWHLHGRPFMNAIAKVSVAAAGIVVAAVIGYTFLSRPATGQVGAGSTPPATSAPATTTPTNAAVGAPACTSADVRAYNNARPGETEVLTELMVQLKTADPCSVDAVPTVVLRGADGTALATANAVHTGQMSLKPAWFYPSAFVLSSWCGEASSLPLSLDVVINGTPVAVDGWAITESANLPKCDPSSGTAITATKFSVNPN
jgi:hypothetical protein